MKLTEKETSNETQPKDFFGEKSKEREREKISSRIPLFESRQSKIEMLNCGPAFEFFDVWRDNENDCYNNLSCDMFFVSSSRNHNQNNIVFFSSSFAPK